jgi:uncharacterized membrane protein (UPF0127 family)
LLTLLPTLLLASPAAADWRFDPVAGQPGAAAPQTGLVVTTLSLRTANGRTHRYRVEVARTADEQAHGMMFRTHMPAGRGMIFPMDPPRPTAFWMRNTLIPLDLVFIGPDGRVINIAERARPLSDDPIPSAGVAAAVLELAGGEAARIGLRPGDTVVSPALRR